MGGEFGFFDRVVAWLVHFCTGIPTDRSKVREEQDTIKEIHSGSVSRETPSGNLSGGGDAGTVQPGESGEPKNERYLHLDCVEGN